MRTCRQNRVRIHSQHFNTRKDLAELLLQPLCSHADEVELPAAFRACLVCLPAVTAIMAKEPFCGAVPGEADAAVRADIGIAAGGAGDEF